MTVEVDLTWLSVMPVAGPERWPRRPERWSAMPISRRSCNETCTAPSIPAGRRHCPCRPSAPAGSLQFRAWMVVARSRPVATLTMALRRRPSLCTRSISHARWGPYGINANCVAPGFVRTGRVAPLLDTMSRDLLQTVALRRYGTPKDCAGVIEFLATDLGACVTGATIAVDGGTA